MGSQCPSRSSGSARLHRWQNKKGDAPSLNGNIDSFAFLRFSRVWQSPEERREALELDRSDPSSRFSACVVSFHLVLAALLSVVEKMSRGVHVTAMGGGADATARFVHWRFQI